MKIKQLIGEYLKKAKMMQVATAKNNQPWACTVYFAYDDDWNLYWISQPSRRHSQEIRKNKKVAGTIVLPHTPGDKVRGLQFQGTAREIISKKDIEKNIKYYAERYKMKMTGDKVKAIINGAEPHFLYKIKPALFVLFDEVNFPDDSRKELPL